jgi:alpha-beta hydrolase superfamily lysophospholipase
MMRIVTTVAALLLVFCGGDGDVPTERPPQTELPATDTIEFVTPDGVNLVGDYVERDEGAGFVLMLHMLGQDRSTWAPLIAELNVARGYLALDMRGHGESIAATSGSSVDFDEFDETDWAKLPDDAVFVLSRLREDKPSPFESGGTVIVGASIGANAALLASAADTSVSGVVLLSPGLNYRGLETKEAAVHSTIPMLIVASSEDEYSAESCRELDAVAENSRLIMLSGAGHGTRTFAAVPELADTVAAWIAEVIGPR